MLCATPYSLLATAYDAPYAALLWVLWLLIPVLLVGLVLIRFQKRPVVRWFAAVVETLVWMLGGLGVLALITGIFGTLLFLTFFAPVAALLFLMLWARAARRARQRRAFTLLGYLEQAMRLNLPLAMMLAAAERSEPGKLARRLQSLRQALESGATLGESLERYAPEVPWQTRRTIAVAERLGRLPAVLTRLHRRTLSQMREQANDPVLGGVYGVVILCGVLGFLGFVNLLIIPKYIEIFDDFQVPLPWITRATFSLSGTNSVWLLLVAIVLIGLVAGGALRAISGDRGKRPVDGTWLDGLWWRLPGSGGAVRARAWATAHEMTAEALRAGCRLPDALRQTGDTAINRVARQRVLHMADVLDRGGTLGDAAADAGLSRLDRGMLATAAQAHDPAETFTFLSRYHAARFSRAMTVLRAAMLPGVVVLLGLVVGWVTVSMFYPLVTLIESLTPTWEIL